MSTPTPPEEQALLVHTAKGVVYLDAKKLSEITPEMLRAVEASAMEKLVDDIAAEEGVSIYCINRRLKNARKLLNTYSTFGAYRLLLLARKLELK
ncbi:MAG: hypothetical protein K9J17_01000 [Flavobacteriales bacterium]|nr:hypothetical protein [Flavobacteriales bacterium]